VTSDPVAGLASGIPIGDVVCLALNLPEIQVFVQACMARVIPIGDGP
jgi:hypothetical protein